MSSCRRPFAPSTPHALRALLAAVPVAFVAACSAAADPPAAGADGTDGGGALAADAAPGVGPGPGRDADAPEDGGPLDAGGDAAAAPSCTRDAAGRGAPAALYDALAQELPALDAAARPARVARFFEEAARQGGFPLEDGDRVVFVTRTAPPGGAWGVTGSFVGWDPARAVALTELAGAGGLWAGEARFAGSETYKLVSPPGVGGAFVEDRLARHVVWDGVPRTFPARGETNAVAHAARLPAGQGRVEALRDVLPATLSGPRDVFVYLPPAYDAASCPRLPSVVVHDGNDALTHGNFAGVADALYAAKPALSAVLVLVALSNQDDRMSEYTQAADPNFPAVAPRASAYVTFLADELVPRVGASHRLCARAEARGVSGASLGGLVSLYAALERPATFGWVGAQSGTFWWAGSQLAGRVASSPAAPVRVYLDSGCPDDNCDSVSAMHRTLVDKGYVAARVTEPNAPHEWGPWSRRLPGMLEHFRQGVSACD